MHPAPRSTLRIGDTFTLGNPALGRATFVVVQRLADDTRILYRTNHGRRDERNRYYVIGGGRLGLRRLEDD